MFRFMPSGCLSPTAGPLRKNGGALPSGRFDGNDGRPGIHGESDLNDLPDIATKISMELRNQYVIGYRPSDRAHDGKWRKIKVKLRPPKGLPPLTVVCQERLFRARALDRDFSL